MLNQAPKKVAVFVSGGGTNLQAILDSLDKGDITNCEIAVVVSSNSSAYALERAKKKNIPTEVCGRKCFDSMDEYDDVLLAILAKYDIDYIVLAGFMSILSSRIIDSYTNKIINVHPALIPSFCGKGFYGLTPHEYALEYGVKVSGATVHFVNAEPDGGPIIMQKAVDVLETDTPEVLQRRVMEEAEWIMLPKTLDLLCNDKIKVDGRKVCIEG